jgi:hypothetical protein
VSKALLSLRGFILESLANENPPIPHIISVSYPSRPAQSVVVFRPITYILMAWLLVCQVEMEKSGQKSGQNCHYAAPYMGVFFSANKELLNVYKINSFGKR